MAANVSIPFEPIPFTFETTVVVLIGMVYGARNAAYVISTYYIAGILGLPVFANFGFGFHTFFGPTGGYLLGFLPAAFVSGYLAQRGWAKSILTSFVAAAIGICIIFLAGITTLSQIIGWHQAVMVGIMPFIISEPVKLVVAAVLAPRLWKQA